MKIMTSKMRGSAIAALLSLPLATGAAFAQQSQGTDQTQQSTERTQQQPSQSGSGETSSGQTSGSEQASNAVVATVGSTEILGSDVMTFIGALPPQLQSQPPQMLLPMALDQLILRELILENARSQNLADDPEVVALAGSAAQAAEDDAMVQVWLTREMANVVTEAAVQQAYDDAKAQGQQNLPPIEVVRPQIEQYLRQQEIRNIGMRLREGAQIVLFDATGQPIEQQQGGQTQQGPSGSGGTGSTGSTGNASGGQSGSGDASGSTAGGQSGGSSGGQATDGTSGSSDTSGTPALKN